MNKRSTPSPEAIKERDRLREGLKSLTEITPVFDAEALGQFTLSKSHEKVPTSTGYGLDGLKLVRTRNVVLIFKSHESMSIFVVDLKLDVTSDRILHVKSTIEVFAYVPSRRKKQ